MANHINNNAIVMQDSPSDENKPSDSSSYPSLGVGRAAEPNRIY
jgi:hypothetical protein